MQIKIDELKTNLEDKNLKLMKALTLPESPRSAFLRKKFEELDGDEAVLENYCCAARMKILLQGMLYVTQRNIYFYSPFNNRTIFGHGTKIKIPFSAIRLIKKESTLLIFPNAIRFVLQSREEVVFASFVSRDTCYSLIIRQFAQAGYSSLAIDCLQDKSTKKSRAAENKRLDELAKSQSMPPTFIGEIGGGDEEVDKERHRSKKSS